MNRALVVATLVAAATPAFSLEPLPESVNIVEKLGDRVPKDLVFTDENGRKVTLGDYLHDGKPVLLAPVYFKCPLLCSLTLNGLVASLKQQSWQIGNQFRVITVSFDPAETPELAHQKQKGYMGALGLSDDKSAAWPFLTGDAANIAALTDAIGFKYRWDAVNKTWDHTAAIVALSPDGQISRYLYGVTYPPNDVKMSLFEAAGGRVGTAFDRVLLRCYAYDTSTKSYRLFAVRFMRAGSLLVLGLLVTFLTILWRRDLRRSRAEGV